MLAKIKKNYFILIFTILFLYFSLNLLDGERGLFSYFEKKNTLNELINEKIKISKKKEILHYLKAKEIKLTKKITDLENINSLLFEKLDPDYIDILIREKFMLGKKGETTYITNNDS